MMKNKYLFIVLLLSFFGYGQRSETFILNWSDENAKSYFGSRVVSTPQFQPQYMDYSNGEQVFFSVRIPSASAVNESSLQITNIVYESITREQLGDLKPANLPATINASLRSINARGQFYAAIKLSPIIKEGNTYRRVKSFSCSYSLGRNTAFRGTSEFDVITNSVLASGEWYRFYVEKSGVYKVTRGFLQQLGFNVNTDPRKIKIYGNGGRMLPLLNATEYPSDLEENAITFIGEQDGAFDNDDYILFYAEGVKSYTLNEENGTHNNLYAEKSYYYVTAGGADGKRIGTMPQPTGNPTVTTTTFDEYQHHEEDLVSVARLGRRWHGEQFNVNNDQSFEFTIPDVVTTEPVIIRVNATAKSVATTSMAVTANNSPVGTISLPGVPSGSDNSARDGNLQSTFTTAGDAVTVNLSYSNGGVPGSNAWLDYIVLEAKRRLRGNGTQYRFRYKEASAQVGVIEYQFTNASSINEVWDITDIYNVSKTVNQGSQGAFSFKASLGENRDYMAVSPSDYYTPLRDSDARVTNQNLKGTIFNGPQGQFQDIDYIIVAPAFLNGPAERLANIHRTLSGLNVKVVSLESIYKEFSSGKQDIGAIRNFIKYVYNNASSESRRIKYVNLFGDASFDYKDRIPNNTNVVPTFHAYGGTIPDYNIVSTFVSDEFFGLMDPSEGRLLQAAGLDIAVGRMLVNSVAQADEMVNKVSEYVMEESYGRWRNEYILISDDLDNGGGEFVSRQEGIASELEANRPFINTRKIYADAYLQQASSGGQRYPDAKEQIIRSINYGALVVNYLGHGNINGLASERIFETSDAVNLNNRFKYPLFVTATCELTKFDDPFENTAGENIYWNPAGGAIAMITTTRSIYVNVAFTFNEILVEKLYAFGSPEYPSMAEALRQTKVQQNSDYTQTVAFIGDPALMLAVPGPRINLTQINDVPVAESTDVLEALSYVKLGGNVTDDNGNVITSYNGEVAVTVFDKPIERTTLANDTGDPADMEDFSVLGETIFRGNATVANGKFEFGFVVPKDIKIPVGEGRVSFYAKRNNVLEDQTGFNNVIRVGGINENAAVDNTPPRVKLYMNDESFVSGGITNASPILLAFLEDENGMNTASGIGHDMVAILDGDETNQYLLNDYYESDVDDYTRGSLRFPFSNLEKGLHTLTFKGWDVYNNLVTAEIQFVVAGEDGLTIEKVLNYPNPFVSYTEFWFTHNRPFEPLDVQVQVFTVTGKVVKTINQSISTDGFLSRDIKWDGRDDFGDKIGKGVYIYKLTVRSSVTNKTAEKYEKLVLL